jgi:hypothetical protein
MRAYISTRLADTRNNLKLSQYEGSCFAQDAAAKGLLIPHAWPAASSQLMEEVTTGFA